MKRFSERHGLIEMRSVLQIDEVSAGLRTRLWNCLEIGFWAKADVYHYRKYYHSGLEGVWNNIMKRSFSELRALTERSRRRRVEEHFMSCTWHEVYDLLEEVVQAQEGHFDLLSQCINRQLEEERSGYRLVNRAFVPIVSEVEIQSLEEALDSGGAPSAHLRRALELLSERPEPDIRNSIKESISAVEAMAGEVAGKPLLPEALKVLEKQRDLHPALRLAFDKLYGYSSDEGGVRHALTEEEARVGFEEGKFMLTACTAFVNYLRGRMGSS